MACIRNIKARLDSMLGTVEVEPIMDADDLRGALEDLGVYCEQLRGPDDELELGTRTDVAAHLAAVALALNHFYEGSGKR